jgi:hypothetical protein
MKSFSMNILHINGIQMLKKLPVRQVVTDNAQVPVQVKLVRPMTVNTGSEVKSIALTQYRQITKPGHHLSA